MIDTEALRTFIAVHRQKGFSGAARTLRRTQPAISTRIRLLEQDLGVRLFERTANGIMLSITNNTTANLPVDVTDTYTNEMRSKDLAPGDTVGLHFWLPPNHNWYDLIVTTSADADFVRQCAGHVQNGEPSISDPKMAQVPPRRHIHGGGGGPEVHRDEGQSRAERSRGPGYRK